MAEEVVVKVLKEAALAGQFDQPADIYGNKVLENSPVARTPKGLGSEERRGGKEWAPMCRSRGSAYP